MHYPVRNNYRSSNNYRRSRVEEGKWAELWAAEAVVDTGACHHNKTVGIIRGGQQTWVRRNHPATATATASEKSKEQTTPTEVKKGTDN
jgi:hypothetical protein